MNVDPLSSSPSGAASLLATQSLAGTSGPTAAQLKSDRNQLATTGGMADKGATSKGNSPADIKKAASQFEAIILRQLLAPSIEPVMSGGLGGSKDSGGGIYGYMLTDTLANSLAQGGGLGWAKLLQKQLSSGPHGADNHSSSISKTSTAPSPL